VCDFLELWWVERRPFDFMLDHEEDISKTVAFSEKLGQNTLKSQIKFFLKKLKD
jgi:hypothetical protein